MILKDYLPYRLNLLAEQTSENTRPIYRSLHDLTRTEWRVLVNLGQAESLTATDLIKRTPAHKTKVSRALAALEERGWVMRETDSRDRRVAHARLTRAGRRALDQIEPQMLAATETMLAPLSAQEREQVDAGLRILERLMEQNDPTRS